MSARRLPSIYLVKRLHTQTESAQSDLVRAALQPATFAYVDQLTKYLRNNFILHEPGRFLIVPKPYGVSCLGSKQEDGGVFTDGVRDKKDTKTDWKKMQLPSAAQDVTLADCIPTLSRMFNEPKLSFCVGLKRYLSGAIVLPANQIEFENMKKSIKYVSRQEDECHFRALAILMGSPPENEGVISGYSTFQAVGKHKEYIFVPGRAKRRAKSGKFAVEGSMEYRILERKYGCSLVEFGISKFARHLPRLMFSHMLCPILGDSIYGNRLVDVDGQPAGLNPSNQNRNVKLWFPNELSSRLNFAPDSLRKSMPLYCHVYQTVFPRYGWAYGRAKSEQDVAHLVAAAPPPSHFYAMVQSLQMSDALSRFMKSEDEGESDYVGGDARF